MNTSSQQANGNIPRVCFPPSAPARIPSVNRGTLHTRNVLPVRILPQAQRIGNTRIVPRLTTNRVVNTNNNLQTPIIISPSNRCGNMQQQNLVNGNKKYKREKKDVNGFYLLFLKWMRDLPLLGIDVSCYTFDKEKMGVFCNACMKMYSTG